MMEKLIQISAGKGPAECCWVVAQVLRLLLEEARSAGLNCTVLSRDQGVENGTLNSALVQLEGHNIDEFLRNWLGTIQWIGQSAFRTNHKRKNWFVGVSLVEFDEQYDFKESDIKYQAIRSGGPGGQHVNKVSTAIRATHQPTGLTVLASDNRSQLQNKKQAKTRLMNMLKWQETQMKMQQVKENWQQHQELVRGNPVRVFKGTDFKSNYVQKGYKATRQKLKNELRNGNQDE